MFQEELVATALGVRDASEESQAQALERLLRRDVGTGVARLSTRVKEQSLAHHATVLGALHRFAGPAVSDDTRQSWLETLKRIAADPKQAPGARRSAVREAMRVDWPGRDDWFFDLFRLSVVRPKYDFSGESHPLIPPLLAEREVLIPRVAKLLRENNPITRGNAAACLAFFHLENARRDALLPLIPWISDPKWVRPWSRYDRLRLLQSVTRIELPECTAALRKGVSGARDAELTAFAEAIAHYNLRDALPALKLAAQKETDAHDRRDVVRPLLKLNGFTVEELATGAREYATKVAAYGEQEWSGQAWEQIAKAPHPLQLNAAHEICTTAFENEAITKAVLAEISGLLSTNPRAAAILQKAIVAWPTPSSHAETIRRLRAGTFSGEWLHALLSAKTKVAEALTSANDLGGAAAGIRAALVRDARSIADVFAGNDHAATRALLAAARVKRLELPISSVGALLDSEDKTLASAADAYLEAIDTPEARRELQQRAAGQARILGSEGFTGRIISEAESKLRQMVLEPHGPGEVFALLSSGTWGGRGQRALLVYPTGAVLRSDDGNGRARSCAIAAEEVDALRTWLTRRRVAELPPYDEGADDGIQWRYVHVTRNGGERVFMNNPPGGMSAPMVMPAITEPRPEPIIYGELTRRMRKLDDKPMQVSYPTLEHLPGFRVIHAMENGEVTQLAFADGKLRAGVFVGQERPIEWREVQKDALSPTFTAGEPPKQPGKRAEAYTSTEEAIMLREGPSAGRELWSGTREKDDVNGLWLSKGTDDAELLARGRFGRNAVICPGGEWIVVAKTFGDNMWAEANGVVRVNLTTRQILPVDLPPADNFEPVVWVEAHQRVLLFQQRDEQQHGRRGPEKAEYWLLDPTNGKLGKVEGDFRPLRNLERHTLQPTGRPHEFWAAIHRDAEPEKGGTVIGRYDTAHFRFDECVEFPGVHFESWHMAVDANARVLSIAVNGDVIEVQLPDC